MHDVCKGQLKAFICDEVLEAVCAPVCEGMLRAEAWIGSTFDKQVMKRMLYVHAYAIPSILPYYMLPTH
jgi:hypothetical protein